MPIAKEHPEPSEVAAIRQLVDAHGTAAARRLLKLHSEPLARILAGLGVRSGTVYQVRTRLAELRAQGANP